MTPGPAIAPIFAGAESSDMVHYRKLDYVRQLKGTVVDFNGQGLTIMLPSGQKRLIPAEQVIRIDSQRTPAQRAARLATKDGQFEKAASNYYRLLESGAEDLKNVNLVSMDKIIEEIDTIIVDALQYIILFIV